MIAGGRSGPSPRESGVELAPGLGLTNRIQATVVAPNTATTDALATTVCVLGQKRGLALVKSVRGTAAFILTEEGGVRWSFSSKTFQRLPRASQ